MPRDPRTYLWDARRAASLISDFVAAQSWNDYEGDPLLRSGVERQFEIIGEALNQLTRVDEHLAAQVPDVRRIVAFRNILIHRYAAVDDRLVWEAATDRIPDLIVVLDRLLEDPS